MKMLFVGNRCAVFDAATRLGLVPAKTLVVRDSFLEKRLLQCGSEFTRLESRDQLIAEIAATDFDLLVSNGCPYIIPVSALRKPHQVFVNVHPSLLPHLRGRHPVNGAVLFGLPIGASCHLMDDDVDTGPVISRIPVDVVAGADLALLYQLTFLAEADAFVRAYAMAFMPDPAAADAGSGSYYSRTEDDLLIDFGAPLDLILRRVAAFAVPGQMARFPWRGGVIFVAHAEQLVSAYVTAKFADAVPGSVVLRYGDAMVVKLADGYLRLSGLHGDPTLPLENDILR